MENYIVSARKYRPSTFKSVVGQAALTATLRNSISKDRLAHAYLFCGSRGVGKTSCARIFAKTINCEHRTPEGEACNECPSCREFNKGNSLNIVELDAASNNGVDYMRELTDQVQVPPVNARYRVFIVDEVHMLSTAAFNAFLKTLEEPPSYVVFILATTEKHKIIPTILSRCQIYDFNRITIQDMVDHLKYIASQENISVEDSALNVIARKADGAMRDALSIFDQVAASSMGNVTYRAAIDSLNILDYEYYDRLVEAFLAGNVPESLLIYKEIRDKGFDSLFFINGLASHFRDLMVAREPATITLLEASDEAKSHIAAVAAKCAPSFLYKAMDILNDADLNYRTASNKQFLVELTLIKLCQAVSPSQNESDAGEGQLRPIASSGKASPASQPTQPQRPVQMTPQPATVAVRHTAAPPPVRPAAVPKPRAPFGGLNVPDLSIKGFKKQDEVKVSEAEKPYQRRNGSFTDEQFSEAWKSIMDNYPTEHLMINAMRISNPQRSGDAVFKAVVESEAIRDILVSSMQLIVGELRSRLLNDYVTLEVTLNKEKATVTSLTDAEAFQVMRKNHPYFNKFIDDFHLTLI
ncbi:MAG: DNA polymerase III subunit gamma/tau [Bacteroides sp.]|nr:DNA polymerase III subunit gamma/tau [Bacteroides sp.]MCM1389267.1 DNA polymerase III subunit gamma/tau [Bacteroides sp.]